MATSQKLQEHFLTCTICTEVFVNPCTLVCYHTFCRKCVVKYTKTKPEAISAKSLLCPFCGKMTTVTSPERPIDEWADDVKPSFVIQGLLDSFDPGCKDAKDCTCCRGEGETTPATVWCSECDDALCEACARAHRRFPATRLHNVIDLSGDVNIPRKRKVMCNEHKDECIKFLCIDCKKLTCHTCCVIYHRKCESVVTLESELPAMKFQLLKKKETILKKQMEMETKVEGVKVKVVSEKDRYVKMEQDIKYFGERARKGITLMENKLLHELKEVSEKHIEQLTTDIKSGEMSVQMYRQQTELIEQAVQSECDMEVYEMYQGCEAGDVDAVGDVDVRMKGRIARITLRQNTDRLRRSLDDLQLGEIAVQYDDIVNLEATPVSHDPGKVLDLKAAPVLRDTIDVSRVAGDKSNLYPTDVTVLLVNGINTVVLADYKNSSVKSFYTTKKQRRHSKLGVRGRPWGITRLKHNQVAVTVPDTRQIVTIKVKPDPVLLSTITTSKQYWGITFLTPSTLAVGCDGCVDILNMMGHVLKSIHPVNCGEEIIDSPPFLCTTRTGNILVSDGGSNRVLCVTVEGDVVFTYPTPGRTTLMAPRFITPKYHKSEEFVRRTCTSCDDISYLFNATSGYRVSDNEMEGCVHLPYNGTRDTGLPRGITSTGTGDILVTDNDQHTVVHLTESGQFVRNILTKDDGVSYPLSVCVDGRGLVYVCNQFSREIKVFTFSNTGYANYHLPITVSY